jgi:hypothetical protein
MPKALLPLGILLLVGIAAAVGVDTGVINAPFLPATRIAARESPPDSGPTTAGRSLADPPVGPALDQLAAYRAPELRRPLRDLDPGLAARGPRPSLQALASSYQYGDPAVMLARSPGGGDWRLSKPDQAAVRGYADRVSVMPGASIGIALRGNDPWADLDVYRMGRGDARAVLHIAHVAISPGAEASPEALTGRVEERWQIATRFTVGADWASGLYLVKLTGASGGQSYVLFVVRALRPGALTVVVPTMTYQAYNDYGGADLYGWDRGPQRRAFVVSYDRPYSEQFGAGLFFRLDFPLVVWLEDHGYAPDYVADVDLAHDPGLLGDVKTLVFSGHSEYWTGTMRDAVERAAGTGANVAFFGANQAFWQVRLGPDAVGSWDRDITCYKSAALDPEAARNPAGATVRFGDPPVNRPPSLLIGEKYGGIIDSLLPMTIGSGIAHFAPNVGLSAGERLPGLVGEEVDELHPGFSGLPLGLTGLDVVEHPGEILVGTSVWINPRGGRVFDAGTFDYSWGLDPRYSADLPGFPAAAFSDLTARILAWLGTQPTV